MENPNKIEIEGLKTIHKLCNFGADHNMEGCSFTEIVERMFDELAKAQAVPEGFVLVPKEPTDAMLFAASGRDIVAEHYGDENILWPELRETWKAMITAAQEPTND